MAPPARRRRPDTDEELQAKIEALSVMGRPPPSLGLPSLDARAALIELAEQRERENASPPLDAPDEPPPRSTKPTLDELLEKLPPLPTQKPLPPKPTFVREDNEPLPRDEAQQQAAPPEPTYVPPPELPYAPQQEQGPPLPEPEQDAVTGASRALAAYKTAPSPNTWATEGRSSAAPNTWATEDRPPPPPLPDSEAQSAREALADYARDPSAPSAPAPAAALAPAQAPPPASGPDYSGVQGRVASTPQQGDRPDNFGHDDDPGFTRQSAIEKVRALYGEETGADRRWEDEFLQNHRGRTDEDIDRAWLMQSTFFGNERGDAVRKMLRDEQYKHEQGLSEARQADQNNRRVSPALAEALAATGQMSPEAAAQMRLNDPLLKQFGQFASQGGRAEHLDYQRDKVDRELLAKIALQEELLKSLEKRQGMKDDTQKAVADKYAARRTAEKSEERLSPERKRDVVGGLLHETYADRGLTGEVAREAAVGVYSNVPTAIRDRVESESRRLNAFEKVGDFRSTAMAPTVASSKGNIAAENAERTARSTIQLKPAQIKENKDITMLAASVRRAAASWQQMSQGARDTFVSLGREAPASFSSKGLGEYQPQAGDLQELVGTIRRQTLGLAQTIPELQALATQMGMTAETWDPFKGSKAFERAMQRILDEARLRKTLLDNLSKPRQGQE